MKQLAITKPRCIGDGDLIFRTRHVLISDDDLAAIKKSCKWIYDINNGDISGIKLDEWSKVTEFEDIYNFFINDKIPTWNYYCTDYNLLEWDDKCTVKTTFKYDEINKMLKVWSLGYRDVRTCWGNKDDFIAECPGYFCKQKDRLEKYVLEVIVQRKPRYYCSWQDSDTDNISYATWFSSLKEAKSKLKELNKGSYSCFQYKIKTLYKGIDFAQDTHSFLKKIYKDKKEQ